MDLDTNLLYSKPYKDDLIKKTKMLWNFSVDNNRYLRTNEKMVEFHLNYPNAITNMTFCEDTEHFCISNIVNNDPQLLNDGVKWRQQSMTSNCKVSIKFCGDHYGTYYQTFVFQDKSTNYHRTRIVVDYLSPEASRQMEAADHYLNSQLDLIADDREPMYWHSLPDPEKRLLERTYPRLTKTSSLSHDLVAAEELNQNNYRNVMKQLVQIEETCRLAHISKFNCTKKMKLLSSYRLGSDDGSDTIIKYAPAGQFLILLELDQDGTEDSAAGRLMMQSCDEVNVTIFPMEVTFRLRMEDRTHHCVGFRLNRDLLQRHWPPYQLLQEGMEVEMSFAFLQNRIPFCQWQLAIDLLPDTKYVFPPVESPYHHAQTGPMFTGNEQLDSVLNYQQRHAVNLMLEPRQIYKPPIMIVGAFGTGKTFTIAHGIRRIIENQTGAKILLCTHSNSAADLYVKEYFDRWYSEANNPDFKAVRIYYPERVRTTVNVDVQKYCLFTENGMYFRYPCDEDLKDCKITVTTLMTSFSLLKLDYEPTHIIIDEAAQAFECEAIMPLIKATQKTQLVLAGDNLQIRPEVYSHLAKLRGFGISLLERLDNLYDLHNENRVILRTNYRSHPKIIDLMTGCMYGRTVQKNTDIKHRPNDGLVQFIHVQGIERKTHHSTGYYNMDEIDEIVNVSRIMKEMWHARGLGKYGEGSIGVLTHYSEQVSAIRSAMRQNGMHEVSVERIQNVQGKQFPVVIISTVITRNNNRLGAMLNVRNYGFLTDKGLLNTAITRAKNVVIVVGDLLALMTMGSCQTTWRHILKSSDHIEGTTHSELFEDANKIEPLKNSPLNPEADPFFPCKSKNKNVDKTFFNSKCCDPTWRESFF